MKSNVPPPLADPNVFVETDQVGSRRTSCSAGCFVEAAIFFFESIVVDVVDPMKGMVIRPMTRMAISFSLSSFPHVRSRARARAYYILKIACYMLHNTCFFQRRRMLQSTNTTITFVNFSKYCVKKFLQTKKFFSCKRFLFKKCSEKSFPDNFFNKKIFLEKTFLKKLRKFVFLQKLLLLLLEEEEEEEKKAAAKKFFG